MAHERNHPYHLVDPSPWPLLSSVAAFFMMLGAVLAMHKMDYITLAVGIVFLLFCAGGWFRDVIREGNTKGLYTTEINRGLRAGMGLFILSEVMLFVSFFWAYFHSAINPVEATGYMWPPKDIITFDPFHFPYLNTLILLLSGTTVTWAHHALMEGKRKELLQGLALTVGLGVLFTTIQGIEYASAKFAIKDGIYPTTFYIATGFHGAHVIIGTLFLAVCWFRAKNGDFEPKQHVGFEAAAWYWHFVDVVWLFLFVSIYWWGYRPVLGH